MSRKIRIGGLNYELVSKDLGMNDAGSGVLGECDYDQNQISITNKIKLSAERKFDVFMHECIHAIMHETTTRGHIKDGMVESFVSSMSAPLASFIRDNFPLIRKMGRF